MVKKVALNVEEQQELMRRTSGSGGFQALIEGLQNKVDKVSGQLSLSNEDLEKIPRYAFDYGNGGFEGRLRKIFERELGASLGR